MDYLKKYLIATTELLLGFKVNNCERSLIPLVCCGYINIQVLQISIVRQYTTHTTEQCSWGGEGCGVLPPGCSLALWHQSSCCWRILEMRWINISSLTHSLTKIEGLKCVQRFFLTMFIIKWLEMSKIFKYCLGAYLRIFSKCQVHLKYETGCWVCADWSQLLFRVLSCWFWSV